MHAILVDVTRCQGCDRCVLACAEEHRYGPLEAVRERITTGNGLSARRLLMPLRVALTGHEHGPELHYVLGALDRAATIDRLRAALEAAASSSSDQSSSSKGARP